MNETTPPVFSWSALHRRARAHPWLKGLGTAGIMTVFFIGYFVVLRHPLFPVTTVPATWIDGLVGFQPWTLTAYFSLWLYVSLPASMLIERRQLIGYGAGCVALAVAGLTIFLCWPTTITPPDIDWSQHPWLAFLKSTDSSGNACPSLHVAFSVLAALWFVRMLRSLGGGRVAQVLNALWAALIVHSTLGTHQHVALDALFGIVLGAHLAVWNFIAFPQRDDHGGERLALFTAVVLIKIAAVLLWTSGIPLSWCLLIFFSGGVLVIYHMLAPNAQGLVRVLSRFETDRREVWLTFDDGPDPDDTPRILDLLDQHHARATFFLIGERAVRHPELVAEIARRGHEIAHHTHTHPTAGFWCATPARVHRELDAVPPALTTARRFRAPVGIKPLSLGTALKQRGLTCIGWTIRSGDSFAHDPAAVAARVRKKIRPGAIILLHEGPSLAPAVRVQAITQVLTDLTADGYRCIIPPDEALR